MPMCLMCKLVHFEKAWIIGSMALGLGEKAWYCWSLARSAQYNTLINIGMIQMATKAAGGCFSSRFVGSDCILLL